MAPTDHPGDDRLTNPFAGGKDLARTAARHRLGGEGRRNPRAQVDPGHAHADPGAAPEASWSQAAFADLLARAQADRHLVVRAMREAGNGSAVQRMQVLRGHEDACRAFTQAQLWWLAEEWPRQQVARVAARDAHRASVLGAEWEKRKKARAQQRRRWRRQAGAAFGRWVAWQARRAALGARRGVGRALHWAAERTAVGVEDFSRAMLGQKTTPASRKTMRRRAGRALTGPARKALIPRPRTPRSPIDRGLARVGKAARRARRTLL